ncbi:hypothetical protein ABE527_02410 [Brucella sp. TWI432]
MAIAMCRFNRHPVAYTYLVARERRTTTNGRWALSVLLDDGLIEPLTTYRNMVTALAAARTLASLAGNVELRLS